MSDIINKKLQEFKKELIGKTITDVIKVEDPDAGGTFGIVLNDGSFMFATSDAEFNGFGTIRRFSAKNKELNILFEY